MNVARYEFILRRLATIGAVAILTLSMIAAVTGILLAFYYEPAAGAAYDSLKAIATEVPNGWLFLSLHDIAGQGAIALALIEIVVMFLGRQFRPSWYTAWISGIVFTLTAIGLSWTAMILDWSEIGFWRLKIELGIVEAIPVIGSTLRDIITGGEIGTGTVERLYAIHSYILSVGAIILALIHLGSLLVQEEEQKRLAMALAVSAESELQEQSDGETAPELDEKVFSSH
jgi:cytochrome b6